MEEPEKATMESMDIAEEKRSQLQKIFPEVFAEGKVNFDQLKRVLGEWIEPEKERFGLGWAGKAECMRIIQKSSIATLKPDREESVNFDETENVFIEGDNLEVLKLLQKSYFGKIKMIYIDPPYNTGKEFIYPDKYSESLETYLEYTGQVDSHGRKFSTNSELSGRYHSSWLNMMYPRLYLAKNLLREDGVVFISIDDNEQANLKALCDQIFGAENLVSIVPRVAKRTSDKGTYFRPTKDYVVVYAKNVFELQEFGVKKTCNPADYKLQDNDGRRYKQSGASLYQPSLDSRPNQRYYIEAPDGSLIIPPGNVFPDSVIDGAKIKPLSNTDKVWRWSVDTYKQNKDKLIFTKGSSKNPLVDENGKQSKWNIYPKVYLDEDEEATLHPEDIIYDYPNSQGTKELLAIDIPFSFSKPSNLIKHLIKINQTDKEIVILDFFAGSCTTAQAVMELNAEDGGNRKYVCVQLPEPTDNNTEAFRAGYKNIADIGKERIRRAADKIREEQEGKLELNRDSPLDLGFKVFKLSSSNFKIWNGEVMHPYHKRWEEYTEAEKAKVEKDLIQQLEDHIEHVNKASSQEDILYELLLKSGFPLTTSIDRRQVPGGKVYSIEDGVMFICLEKKITPELIEAIAQERPFRVICLDEGFQGNDQLKTNAVQTFKARAQKEESEIVFRTV